MSDKDLVEARTAKAAWKKSIFATDKVTRDLRRRNTVRDIYMVGYNDGHDDGYAEARDFYYPKLKHAADKGVEFARSVASPADEKLARIEARLREVVADVYNDTLHLSIEELLDREFPVKEKAD